MPNEHPLHLSEEHYTWIGNDGGHKIGRKVMIDTAIERMKVFDSELMNLMFEPMGSRLVYVAESALTEYLGDENNPRRKQCPAT